MASSREQKFLIKLQAEYAGEKAIDALKSDLKSIDKIDAFHRQQKKLMELRDEFATTKSDVKKLRAELEKSFDPALEKKIGTTAAQVDKFSAQLGKQKERLSHLAASLAHAGKEHALFAASIKGTPTEKEAAKLERLNLAISKAGLRYKKQASLIESTSTKLAEATKKREQLTAAWKKSSDPAILRQLKAAEKDLARQTQAIADQKEKVKGTTAALKGMGHSLSGLKKEYAALHKHSESYGRDLAAMRTLGVRSFKEVKAEITGLKQAYAQLEANGNLSWQEKIVYADRMKKKIFALKEETNGWKTRLGELRAGWAGILGLIAGGAGFVNLAGNMAKSAKELKIHAELAGTGVEQFSAFAYAAKTVGIEQEKLADISKDVRDKLGDFIATGGGEMKDFFENVGSKVGLTAKSLQHLSGPEVLVAMKKAMDDAGISEKEQVFYLEAIANDASKLTPLLKNNAAALREKAAEARRLGLTISEMDNEKLIRQAEATLKMKESWAALGRDLVGTLAPVLTATADGLRVIAEQFRSLSPVMQSFIGLAGTTATALIAWHSGLKDVYAASKLAFSSMGGQIIKLQQMSKEMGLLKAASSSMATKFGLLGGVLTAAAIGWEIGTWLNKFDIVKKAGIAMTAGIHKGLLRLKQAWVWVSGGDTEAVKAEIAQVDAVYAKMYADIDNKSKESAAARIAAEKEVTAAVVKGEGQQAAAIKETGKLAAAKLEAQRKLSKRLADDAYKSSHSRFAVQRRALKKEIAAMRKTAAGKKEILAQIEAYRKRQLAKIAAAEKENENRLLAQQEASQQKRLTSHQGYLDNRVAASNSAADKEAQAEKKKEEEGQEEKRKRGVFRSKTRGAAPVTAEQKARMKKLGLSMPGAGKSELEKEAEAYARAEQGILDKAEAKREAAAQKQFGHSELAMRQWKVWNDASRRNRNRFDSLADMLQYEKDRELEKERLKKEYLARKKREEQRKKALALRKKREAAAAAQRKKDEAALAKQVQAAAAKQKKAQQEIAAAAKKAAAQRMAAAKKLAQVEQGNIAKQKSLYQRYAAAVRKLQDSIAGREKSLKQQLAELAGEKNNSWKSRLAAARNYQKQAQKALEQGRLFAARKFADQARAGFYQLKDAKEAGAKRARRMAYSGVKSAGELGIAIERQLVKALQNKRVARPPQSSAPEKKVVELKLGNARLSGSQGDVDSFIKQLEAARLLA